MDNGIDYYFFGNYFDEDGWRDFSPSQVSQFFTKVGWESGGTDIDLSVTRVHSDLTGNGLTPQSFLDQSWSSIFTRPDNTVNSLWLTNLTASHFLSDNMLLSGNAYYRSLIRKTLNGDVNDDFEEDEALDGAEGANDGAGFNQDTGANNRTNTSTRGAGGSLLFTLLGAGNDFKAGATYDQANSGFYPDHPVGRLHPEPLRGPDQPARPGEQPVGIDKELEPARHEHLSALAESGPDGVRALQPYGGRDDGPPHPGTTQPRR